MATSLEKSKKLNEVSKRLHLSTNPEILVKIAPLVSELRWLESRPLKKILKNIDKTSVKYIALPASLPSGLKNFREISPIYPEAPHVWITTKFCTAVEVVDIITCDKFFSDRFRGINSVGGQKCRVPID